MGILGSIGFVVGGAVLFVTILHAFRRGLFGRSLIAFSEALPDNKDAMLYSLNAMTSYGHENLNLEPRWQMMGALEALNGCIMFSLTTAFLFTVVKGVAACVEGKYSRGILARRGKEGSAHGVWDRFVKVKKTAQVSEMDTMKRIIVIASLVLGVVASIVPIQAAPQRGGQQIKQPVTKNAKP